jgi:hypothetical protein
MLRMQEVRCSHQTGAVLNSIQSKDDFGRKTMTSVTMTVNGKTVSRDVEGRTYWSTFLCTTCA